MQRRVEQAHGHRQPGHADKQVDKVAALHRQNFGQRGASPGLVLGQDHFAHRDDAFGVEKHVLGTAQANTFSAELKRRARVLHGLGIGPHRHFARCIGPAHQSVEFAGQFRLHRCHPPGNHLAGGAIDSDQIAGFEGVAGGNHFLGAIVDA